MQFLICEGCNAREKPCIAVDQIDQEGSPSTCLYDIKVEGPSRTGRIKKKWNKIDAADIALLFFYKGLRIIAGEGTKKVKGICKSCGEIKAAISLLDGLCNQCHVKKEKEWLDQQ